MAFQDLLRTKGMSAHIRFSRGKDVLAACGQLGGETAADGGFFKERPLFLENGVYGRAYLA